MKTYKFCFLFLAMLMAMSTTANAAYKADKNYLDSLTKVAEQGDVEAQKEVGFEYELEKNIPKRRNGTAKQQSKEMLMLKYGSVISIMKEMG